MNSAITHDDSNERRLRPLLLWGTIVAIGALGMALKMPFGRFMLRVMSVSEPPHQSWIQFLLASEWGWLLGAATGCLLLYSRSGLRVPHVRHRDGDPRAHGRRHSGPLVVGTRVRAGALVFMY